MKIRHSAVTCKTKKKKAFMLFLDKANLLLVIQNMKLVLFALEFGNYRISS